MNPLQGLKIGLVAVFLTGLVSYHYFDKKMAVNAAIQEVTQKYEEVFKVWRVVNQRQKEEVEANLEKSEQNYAKLKQNAQIELASVNVKLDRLRNQLASARARATQDSPTTTGIDGTGDNSVPEQLVEEIRYLD
jgi:hypothetical protein